MIIDSSAVVAIGIGEPEENTFLSALDNAPVRRISAGTWIELSAVAVRKKILTADQLDGFLTRYDVVIEPVTADQAHIGHAAYREFGIGSGHEARLNFGDCFAYALAKTTGEPLLFKGNDFIYTDVLPAIRHSLKT